METSNLNVALVGDSVLDDHYWLDHPANDVRAQTERTLKIAYPDRSIRVDNFAVDESTISCVLRGRAPAGMLAVCVWCEELFHPLFSSRLRRCAIILYKNPTVGARCRRLYGRRNDEK